LPPDVVAIGGAIITALVAVVGLLWREHLRADAEDRKQRDEALTLLRDAIDGTKRMADAWEDRNRRDAARRRSSDR